MLKRLSYPLSWMEGSLVSESKDEKDPLPSLPTSADSQHSSVFSKVFSRYKFWNRVGKRIKKTCLFSPNIVKNSGKLICHFSSLYWVPFFYVGILYAKIRTSQLRYWFDKRVRASAVIYMQFILLLFQESQVKLRAIILDLTMKEIYFSGLGNIILFFLVTVCQEYLGRTD